MRVQLGAVLVVAGVLAGATPLALAAGQPAAPSCAEGPIRVGETIVGTACAETIVAPPDVARVVGGGGNDTIVAAPLAAAVPCEAVCLGVGSQTFEGGPGDDVVYGERGNDILRGGERNDRLYGGIGDDLLEGGPGNDLLSGGFGADTIDGQQGSDFVRGDGTTDVIRDTGASGIDTLSYASAETPGFGLGEVEMPGFPVPGFPGGQSGERGVFLDLSATHAKYNGNNGGAGEGGGSDQVGPGAFETIVGSPFSDYIVGSEAGETIYGGGGADLIEGRGGDDHLFGGADGDDLDGGGDSGDTADGGAGENRCQGVAAPANCVLNEEKEVVQRETGKVSVGAMAPGTGLPAELYLTGSGSGDSVTASYETGSVSFTLSGANFETAGSPESGCTFNPEATAATCPAAGLDSILLAGMAGTDHLTASGFPQAVSVTLLGGEGGDTLTGGEASEDLLVDGGGADRASAADVLSALGRDDALLHEGGADVLEGGDGNDLFLSVSICDGETIEGGEGRDNSSWARLNDPSGVAARLSDGVAGRPGPRGAPECPTGSPDSLQGIEDLEGSEFDDVLIGDAGENQLLGHAGADSYEAGPGSDLILANSGDSDRLISCGADTDTAVIDIPTAKYADPEPLECETVRQGAPNEFRNTTELPPPPPVEPPPVAPRPDTTPPRTRITRHPEALLLIAHRHRRVVFAFASSEPGSRFRCRLDRNLWAACRSPRAYWVGLGHHVLRIAAIDAAGNADPTPVRFRFQVKRRSDRRSPQAAGARLSRSDRAAVTVRR